MADSQELIEAPVPLGAHRLLQAGSRSPAAQQTYKAGGPSTEHVRSSRLARPWHCNEVTRPRDCNVTADSTDAMLRQRSPQDRYGYSREC